MCCGSAACSAPAMAMKYLLQQRRKQSSPPLGTHQPVLIRKMDISLRHMTQQQVRAIKKTLAA
jgi:hypothetical protein